MRELTPLEARVVGVLVEKQATVPDTYPLSLNALVAGCNQKTARWPLMEAGAGDVQQAVDGLKSLHLALEGSGSRVVKYEHNVGRVLGVPSQAVALLAVLLLRGPQTSAELRQNSERLHRFADVSSVDGFLDELSTREPQRVLKLPRAPGAREARWAHLLCGRQAATDAGLQGGGVGSDAGSAGSVTLAGLAAEVAELRVLVDGLMARLDPLR